MTTATRTDLPKGTPRTMLDDMIVQELGFVPRGANGRSFILRKGDMDKLKMPAAVKADVQTQLADLCDQLNGTLTVVSAAEEDDTMDGCGPLCEVMKACGNKAHGIAKACMPKSEAKKEGDVEKAVWSTAYINTLPDSSFFHIAPGGTKDDEGKTVPRTLRHLPYKDENGKVDLTHLRNALSRLPQTEGIDAATRDKIRTEAQAILERETAKQDVEKAGKVLSQKNTDAITTAITAMETAVAALRGVLSGAGGGRGGGNAESDTELEMTGKQGVNKSDSPTPDEIRKAAIDEAEVLKKSAAEALDAAKAAQAQADAKLAEVVAKEAQLAEAEKVLKAAAGARPAPQEGAQASNAAPKPESKPAAREAAFPANLTDLLKKDEEEQH